MTIQQALKKYFGYDSFRTGQKEVIESILQKRDTVGIMPTGAGKSICFQLPSLLTDGITIVVSPLISLMKDQVGALKQSGISAAFINSSLTPKQTQLALYNAANGQYKLIYVAPERLLVPEFLQFANSVNISIVTVDEAHCISQWGQDFRPSYALIPQFVNSLAVRPVVCAFTATATPKVREDIAEILQLKNHLMLVSTYNRENLYFEVAATKNKMDELYNFLGKNAGKSGIIYCLTRKTVDEVCEKLNQSGYSALSYHAGLSDIQRRDNQDSFIFDKVKIMVATNAFGMGIDKSNVGYVVHFNMPKDIESYYQEAGRAGRDGTPATCLLLYSGQDVKTNQWLIENTKDKIYEDFQTQQIIKEQEYGRLREMTFYSTTHNCLRGFILKYFGEEPQIYCGNCSNCNTKFEALDVTQEAVKIVDCVIQTNQRFGASLIIDILRGSKNERILSFGFDNLPAFKQSTKSAGTLRNIIDELLLQGYLQKSQGQYPVISLTDKAQLITSQNEKIIINLPIEVVKVAKTLKADAQLSQEKAQLFYALKEMRAHFAKEQNVPAFMVFSDSTIIDMCNKLPQTNEQFLTVSGVGEQKLKRYGNAFIEIIIDFCQSNNIKIEENISPKKNSSKKKENNIVSFTAEDFAKTKVSEENISISVIAENINNAVNAKVVSGKKIADWLVDQGYLKAVKIDDKTYKEPTEKGQQAQIIVENRKTSTQEFQMNLYPKEMQKYIIENIGQIIEM